MGDRKQPTPPPTNQRKPDPPPAPPQKVFASDGVFVICESRTSTRQHRRRSSVQR